MGLFADKSAEDDARVTNELRRAVLEVLGRGDIPVCKRGEMLLAAASAVGEEGRRLATGDWDAKLAEQAEKVNDTLEKFFMEVVSFVGLINTIQVEVDLGVPRVGGHPKHGNWVDELGKYRQAMSRIMEVLNARCPDAVSRMGALAHKKD